MISVLAYPLAGGTFRFHAPDPEVKYARSGLLLPGSCPGTLVKRPVSVRVENMPGFGPVWQNRTGNALAQRLPKGFILG